MQGDAVAFPEDVHGVHCLYALREQFQPVVLYQQSALAAAVYPLRQALYAHLLPLHVLLRGHRQPCGARLHALQRRGKIADEKFRHRRRCLDAHAGHDVQHTLVAVVPYARDDGQWEVGYILCQRQRVKSRQIRRAAATPYYY